MTDIQSIRAELNKPHNIYDRMRETLPAADVDYIRETVIEILDCHFPLYHNTITGRTKNPNVNVLRAISFLTGCSINEILDPEYEFRPLKQNGREELAASLGLSREAA